MKTDITVPIPPKSNTGKQKNFKTDTDEKAGSGSVSQCYGSTNPDPYQNTTDPQNYIRLGITTLKTPKTRQNSLQKLRDECEVEWFKVPKLLVWLVFALRNSSMKGVWALWGFQSGNFLFALHSLST